MELIWPDLKMPVEQEQADLLPFLARKMKVQPEDIKDFRIIRRSIDARKKYAILYNYTVTFTLNLSAKRIAGLFKKFPGLKEKPKLKENRQNKKPAGKLTSRPIVIGTGPAGYFAALTLAENGYRPLVLERGEMVAERSITVQRFWEEGILNQESNVQFGEGGAGTFSDGKLTTRIEDARIKTVLESFVGLGADPEILYAAKPHIGTERLKEIVVGLRRKIESYGGEVYFRTKVTGILTKNGCLAELKINPKESIQAEAAIFAVGHSARDVFGFLHEAGIALAQKPFAVGLRVEHRQDLIDIAQYGLVNHPKLGAADYLLTYKDPATGRGAYSFCMCPGGLVLAASSEEGGVVTNGMSHFARDSGFANSALVVTVDSRDFPSAHPLAGVMFQREWEQKAFLAGGENYYVPAQAVQDFLAHRPTQKFKLAPTYKPGYLPVDLHTILPPVIGEVLDRALIAFDQKIKGFAGDEATLSGIETRTSSPLRIIRDESGQSVNLRGLFPAGEGAGYAGGIVSSAIDGIKAAEKLMMQYGPCG